VEWRRKGGLILDAGGVMAAAVLVRRDVMVVCLWEGFEACDALIWTFMSARCYIRWLFEESVRSSVNKISFYLSRND
jgi:hypothetical protein